ncbi:MAG TPA: LysM peptidoglycan-binding domain-containing protein, partial [Patescibacteria group bacterium]|nr:LysM peptidoglycan-binding domain-containing protein [Patescibacteria group bacterium]
TPEATPTTVAQSDEFAISPTGVAIEAPEGIAGQPLQPVEPTKKITGKTYTVVEGDNLWTIAEKVYGSGYNWVDLANANNLSHPNDIHVGNVLKVPETKLKDATVHTVDDDKSSTSAKISGDTYKILPNDTLWMIAVRAYGDGYKWVEIAKANNLSNPDIIHVDNTLKLPR